MRLFGDILKLVGCKIFSRKLVRLKETHESIPAAWELTNSILKYFFKVRNSLKSFSLSPKISIPDRLVDKCALALKIYNFNRTFYYYS